MFFSVIQECKKGLLSFYIFKETKSSSAFFEYSFKTRTTSCCTGYMQLPGSFTGFCPCWCKLGAMQSEARLVCRRYHSSDAGRDKRGSLCFLTISPFLLPLFAQICHPFTVRLLAKQTSVSDCVGPCWTKCQLEVGFCFVPLSLAVCWNVMSTCLLCFSQAYKTVNDDTERYEERLANMGSTAKG